MVVDGEGFRIPDRALKPRPRAHERADLFACKACKDISRAGEVRDPDPGEQRRLPVREFTRERRRGREMEDERAAGCEGDAYPCNVFCANLGYAAQCERGADLLSGARVGRLRSIAQRVEKDRSRRFEGRRSRTTFGRRAR